MQKGINRNPLKFWVRITQYIYNNSLARSYPHYQPLVGDGFVHHISERDCTRRWNIIKNTIISNKVTSVLDIGCGEGYFLDKCVRECGCFALGIEGDYSRYCVAQSQISYNHNKNVSVIYDEVTVNSINKFPVFDAVVFLSVAHHLMYSYGEEYTRKFLSLLRTKISKTLIFEMGQSDEYSAKWASKLPDMGDNPHEWIQLFLESCGYKNIVKIGVDKSFYGDRLRAIFSATP